LSQWILIEEVELVWVLFDLHSIPFVEVGEVMAKLFVANALIRLDLVRVCARLGRLHREDCLESSSRW
jgi:hypothetical protein